MPRPEGSLRGLLLAAGGSGRLGLPKQLLEMGGEPLVRRAARALAATCDGVRVVTGADAEAVAGALSGVAVVFSHNPDWSRGLAGSLRVGIRDLGEDWDGVLIATCDQPRVTAEDLRRLASAWVEAPGRPAAAAYRGVTGVPAVFPRPWRDRLLALEGDQGARELLRAGDAEVSAVPMPDAALDVDRAADLARAGLRVPADY